MTATPHPYRTAIEHRDPDRLTAALRPDVVFDTPAFQEPIRGRENASLCSASFRPCLKNP